MFLRIIDNLTNKLKLKQSVMDDKSGDKSRRITVGVIGMEKVGKTSLIVAAVSGSFPKKIQKPSKSKIITDNHVEIEEDGVRYNVVLIDGNAQTLPEVQILLYSIKSLKSFERLTLLKEQADQNFVPVCLAATQADKITKRAVPINQATQLASSWGVPFIECSAKTGQGIQLLLRSAIRCRLQAREQVKRDKEKLDNIRKVIKKKDSIISVIPLFSSDDKNVIPAWEMPPLHNRDWTEIEPCAPDLAKSSLLNMTCKEQKGYTLELGRDKIIYESSMGLEDIDKNYPFFNNEFMNKEHTTHVAESNTVGPVVVCLATHVHGHRTRAIVFTKYNTERMQIPAQYGTIKEQLKYVRRHHPKLQAITDDPNFKLRSLVDPDFSQALADLESKEVVSKYKIGLLYVKKNQVLEEDMFSNVDTSPDFEEFLTFLGDRVALKGWSHYAGGLDVKSDSTGSHSIYTSHQGCEIMFHVCTMLPFQLEDKQRVERKRHIGNDVVVLVFLEGDQTFDPIVLTSQFNHVFIVVKKEGMVDDVPMYRMAIANKPMVRPYAPFLPEHPVFMKGPPFRRFLLTKIINSERAAMYSGEFRAKWMATRRVQLEQIFEQHLGHHKKGGHAQSPWRGSQIQIRASQERRPSIALDSPPSVPIVELGKRVQAALLQPPASFDPVLFQNDLQQMLYWAISSESGPKDLQERCIDKARDLTRVGKLYADAHVVSQEDRSAGHQQDMIALLQDLFACIKEQSRSLHKFDSETKESPKSLGSLAGAAHLLNNNAGVLR
eukprot:TRINITY_DN1994_c3_g1_i3.p1 TRINITY_DN1994_c3_g1~~TRINITY_DN1994_c3_g1_i3.p1  ORF type:complete len:775 (-),score=157.70 TRINITY_DN1994_c3_g1_i3:37-2361(-)